MAEAIINYSDLVHDDGAFLKLEKDLDNLGKKLDSKAKEIKSSLSVVGTGDSAKIQELENEIQKLKKSYDSLKSSKEKLGTERKKANDLTKTELIQLQKERIEMRQRNNEAKQIAIITNSQVNSIEKLRAKLSLVTIAWSKLSEQERINSERGRRIVASKLEITNELKKEEQATGDDRRNVGNYAQSIKEAFAEMQKEKVILQENLVILKQEQAQLKKNTKEYDFYEKEIKDTEKQLKKLDNVHTDGISKAKNYQSSLSKTRNILAQLGLAYGVFQGIRTFANNEIQLQRVQLALKNVLGSTDKYNKAMRFLINLSKTYGQDLLVLTDTYKGFIASSESSNLSIEERNKIYQSIIKSGSALSLSNDQIQGSLLAVSQMFSKGMVSAEELRGQLGERLPGAFGIMAKSIGVTERELGKMMQRGEVVAKDVLPKFAEELEKTFGKNAENNIKTIGGAWNVLKTNIMESVNQFNESNKITEKFATFILFLSNNLGTLVSVVSRAVGGFILFKTITKTMATVDLIQLNGGLGATIKNMLGFGKVTDEATEKSKKFGATLRGIGWTVIIGLVFELGKMFYDLATGIESARNQHEALQKAIKQGTKQGQDRLKTFDKEFEKRKAILDQELLKEKITKKQYDLEIKNSKLLFTQRLKAEIQLANESKQRALNQAHDLAKTIRLIEKIRQGTKLSTDELRKHVSGELENFDVNSAHKQIDRFKTVIAEENAMLYELTGAFNELTGKQTKNDIQTELNTKSKKENTTEIEANNTALEHALKLLEIENRLKYERLQLENEVQQEKIDTDIQKELDLQSKNAKALGNVDLQNLQILLDKQSELKKEALKNDYNFRLNELLNNVNNENVEEFQLLEEKRDELLRQENLTNDEKTEINKNYTLRLKELNENIIENEKLTNDERKLMADTLLVEFDKVDKENVTNKENANNQILENQRIFIDAVNSIEQSKYDEQLEILNDSIDKQQEIVSKAENKNKKIALQGLKTLLDEQYNLKVDATKNEYNDKLIQTEIGSIQEQQVEQEKVTALAKIKRQYAKESEKIDKEIANSQKQVWTDLLNEIKSIFSKILDRIEENFQKQVDLNKKKLDDQNNAVEEQRRRAELGLTNTLAFEQKEQAKQEAELLKSQKKLEKTQKVKALYSSYQGYAQSDTKNALAKTLKDFAILEAVTASFGAGGIVEDKLPKDGIFRGASHKSRSGGIPIMVEGKEGIFSTKEMANFGKDNFYSLKNFLNTGKITDDLFGSARKSFVAVVPPNDNNFSELKNEMQMLRNSFENIEHQKVDVKGWVDGIFQIKETLKTKGKTTIYNHKIEKPKF